MSDPRPTYPEEVAHGRPAQGSANFNGAREGLKAKMSYWGDKDYKTEFAILTSQAANLAVQKAMLVYPTASTNDLISYSKGFFEMLLELRSDPELKAKFDAYYKTK